jgi:hypothetical protein
VELSYGEAGVAWRAEARRTWVTKLYVSFKKRLVLVKIKVAVAAAG